MNKKLHLSFGLQFEEHPVAAEYTLPIYDEDEAISFYVDANGNRVPAVEWHGNVGTKTFTNVQAENTDEDPQLINGVSTETATKTQNESSDADNSLFLALSTQTETFVQSEQTDDDPGVDIRHNSPLTTQTATAVVEENTDQD